MPFVSGNRILVVGRAGMDLYADPPGTKVEEATQFTSALGGSAGNIAAAIARLGGCPDLFTAVSDDAVGRFVLGQLQQYGIGTRLVASVGGQHRNSLAVVETRSENTQNVLYRNGAADFEVSLKQLERVDWKAFDCVIVTGTCLAVEPSRSVTFELMEQARKSGVVVVLDVDYRPYSWKDVSEAGNICGRAAELSDIVIGNDEEFAVLDGRGQGKELARKLAANGKVSIYKMGGDGSVTYHDDDTFETGVFRVQPLKPVGAGDAFMGAFIMGLVDGISLRESVRRGSANAALVVSRVGCAPAMATAQEITDFIAQHKGNS